MHAKTGAKMSAWRLSWRAWRLGGLSSAGLQDPLERDARGTRGERELVVEGVLDALLAEEHADDALAHGDGHEQDLGRRGAEHGGEERAARIVVHRAAVGQARVDDVLQR